MIDTTLFPLPGFGLPTDFPWQVGFVAAVDAHLRRLRATGHFVPARFFGYYFRGVLPIAVSGGWTVTLELMPPISHLAERLEYLTDGKFEIASPSRERVPDYMLIHDRQDGACWLWAFERGLRFVEATEPVIEVEGSGMDGAENPKLLEP
jgi:hypothetical protein